jgi:hypothetical protein
MKSNKWLICPNTGRIQYFNPCGNLLGIYIQYEDNLYKIYQYDSTGRYTLRGQAEKEDTAKKLSEKLPITYNLKNIK